ncbi:MAG: apolipoprotein N-acyltransferase [Elusimicrobiota bacterium]|nr:apolipoprotein N-acyltransferase [Elusimicrobiota bacterium]
MLRSLEDMSNDAPSAQSGGGPAPAAGPAAKKLPAWRAALTSAFNGLFLAATILLTAALLAGGYLTESRPLFAWAAFIPFGLGILHMRGHVSGFFYGLAAGALAYLGIIYWIAPTVQAGTGSEGLARAAVLGLSIVLALQFALFGFICSYLRRMRWLFPLGGACAWVALELLHQFIAYKYMAFPWFVLGYTQFAQIRLIQISSFGGAYAVSFLIMLFALGASAALGGKLRGAARAAWLVLPALAVCAAIVCGDYIIKKESRFFDAGAQKLAVALMQPYTHNLLSDGFTEDVVYTVYEAAAALEGRRVDLIIWPESSYPGSYEDNGYYEFLRGTSAKNNNAYQITGSYSMGDGGDYVSAALFDRDGFLDAYHKTKLVPFGEFLPWQKTFKKFYGRYGISSLTGDFVEGRDAGKIFTAAFERGAKNFSFGAGICFESLFPAVWRAQANAGAQFFVNISNDGWFLDTAAPYQHLRANIFRAVENRRPLLRSTNTGISAWVDAFGRVKFQSVLNKRETALLAFDFQPKAGKTFYARSGDIFAYACAVFALSVFIFCAAFLGGEKKQ